MARWLVPALLTLAAGCNDSAGHQAASEERHAEAEREDEVAQLRRRVKELELELRDFRLERDKRLAEQRSGIKLDLPTGQAAEIDPAKPSLVIEVLPDGKLVVAGKPLSDAQLDGLLLAVHARDKLTQVIIKSDRGVGHGRVVEIMEKAKQAGLTRLAIGTAGS